jgi:hypothetical protein
MIVAETGVSCSNRNERKKTNQTNQSYWHQIRSGWSKKWCEVFCQHSS